MVSDMLNLPESYRQYQSDQRLFQSVTGLITDVLAKLSGRSVSNIYLIATDFCAKTPVG